VKSRLDATPPLSREIAGDDLEKAPFSPRARRLWALGLYALLVLLSGSFLFRIARWTKTAGLDWLGPAVLGIFLGLGGILLLVLFIRALRRRRFLHLLFLLLIVAAFFPAYLNLELPLERFHLLLFGTLGILTFWALRPRLYTLQFYLAALNIVLVVSFLDELCQGLVPDRIYDLNDIWVNLFSGAIGILLMRMSDINAPLPLHPHYRKEHAACTESPPLIDLHIYLSDFFYLLPLACVLATDLWLTQPLDTEDLLGVWQLQAERGASLELMDGRHALLDFPDCKLMVDHYLEGNRLDGYRIGVYSPDTEREDLPPPCREALSRAFRVRRAEDRKFSLYREDYGVFILPEKP